MIPLPFYFFILIELLFVTYGDIKWRKISNLWSILIIVVFIVLAIFFKDHYAFSVDSFQYPIVFIIVGFALFMLKIMGGGDSKYLATFFLLVPLKMQDDVFYNLLLATIIIGSMIFLNNLLEKREKIIESFKNGNIQGVKSCFGEKFAYAPVILITWVWTGLNIFKII